MTTLSNEQLREKILNILHKTESCSGCKDHYKSPHKCDMDLAAPRCVKRVKEIEKLFTSQRQALLKEVREGMIENWRKYYTVTIPENAGEIVNLIIMQRAQLSKIERELYSTDAQPYRNYTVERKVLKYKEDV